MTESIRVVARVSDGPLPRACASVEWDGRELVRRSWSWVGLGELHGTAEEAGKHHDVRAVLDRGDGVGTDGSCSVTVDGRAIELVHVR